MKLGASITIDPDTEGKIVRLRRRGLSFAKIADRLNGDDTLPPRGAKFYPSTVNAVLRRNDAA